MDEQPIVIQPKTSHLPRWLHIVIKIILIITIIYWAVKLFIKLWNNIGKGLHYASSREHWWLFTVVFMLCALTILISLEIGTNVKPFTNLFNLVKNWFTNIRNGLAEVIGCN